MQGRQSILLDQILNAMKATPAYLKFHRSKRRGIGSAVTCSRIPCPRNPPTRRPSSIADRSLMMRMRDKSRRRPSTTSCTHGPIADPNGSSSTPRCRSTERRRPTPRPPSAERAVRPRPARASVGPIHPARPVPRRRPSSESPVLPARPSRPLVDPMLRTTAICTLRRLQSSPPGPGRFGWAGRGGHPRDQPMSPYNVKGP